MKYILLHISVRNDETDSKSVCVNAFDSKNDAEKSLFKTIDTYEWDSYYKYDQEKIIKHIYTNGIWIWEWKRRGNGDFYKIIETEQLSEYTFTYDFDEAITIEHMDI